MMHPWAITMGLLAAGLPVFIHWLTKPKPVLLRTSTFRFIRGAVQQRRARYRLRDILVLALRTLAVLLFAIAMARPLLHQQVVAEEASQPSAIVRVVLLDCSQSMAARRGGIAHFDRARPLANDALKSFTSLKANLLLAGATPQPVFGTTTSNLGALREALSSAAVRPERLRVQAALNLAAEMLATSDAEAQLELMILSDFQRSNWASADFSVIPETCEIELRSVADETDAANLAVLQVEVVGRPEIGREAEFTVQVGNYSDTPRQVRAELSIGAAVLPLEGFTQPRSKTTLSASVPLTRAGWQFGSIRIRGSENDALPNDDELAVCVEAYQKPRLAILTRETQGTIGSAADYVERTIAAMRPPEESDAASRESDSVLWIDASEPDVDLLRTAEVVLVVKPGRLTRQTTAVLTAMMQRGKGFLYVAAGALDAANLSDLSAEAGSSARFPVTFLPQVGQRGGTERFLNDVDRKRTPFSVFGDELAAALRSLSFRGGLVSRPSPDGLAEDVRGVLSDQSAFMVVTAVGRGRLAVLNADLERSNLGRTPILLPLLGELVTNELASRRSIERAFSCGEPFVVSLPVGEERRGDLAVVGPDGGSKLSSETMGEFRGTPAGVVWEVPAAGSPGVYYVTLDDRPIAAITTAIPEAESDLRVLSKSVLESRLAGGRRVSYSASLTTESTEQQDDTWVWFAAGCLLCMLAEMTILKLFRS